MSSRKSRHKKNASQHQHVKRNRKPKRVRCKDWIPDSLDDLDALYDLPQRERIMPRGVAEAAPRGAPDRVQDAVAETSDAADGQQGIVVEVSSGLCRVELGKHSLICSVRGTLSAEESGFTNILAVGDEVIVSEDGAERGVVEAVLPRRTLLTRPDFSHDGYRLHGRRLQQVIVANADQLLIVASWQDPALWPELIDRYLITAERNGLAPIICVNKVDLAEDAKVCQEKVAPYINLGYRVLLTSALDGRGLKKLRKVLRGHLTALAGLSGVGKSSLLLALQPDLALRVGEVSDYSHAGRHTTTQVNLIELEGTGRVVDTPGIREFGLDGLRRAELVHFYPEILAVAGQCAFRDCSHLHEPGCAVQAALETGQVSTMRYKNYRKINEKLLD